jgi:hypothetical protein
MLNEEEMAKIIDAANGTVTRYDGHSVAEVRSAAQNAARAIHEAERGRLAWLRVVDLEEDADNPSDVAGWSELDDDYVIYFVDPNPGLPAGRYTVTVTKGEHE